MITKPYKQPQETSQTTQARTQQTTNTIQINHKSTNSKPKFQSPSSEPTKQQNLSRTNKFQKSHKKQHHRPKKGTKGITLFFRSRVIYISFERFEIRKGEEKRIEKK